MTLRRRLVLAVVVAAVLVGGSIGALLVILRASLRDELDKQLLAVTQTLVACAGEPSGDGVVAGELPADAAACRGEGTTAAELVPQPRLPRALVEAHATAPVDPLAPFDASVDGRRYRAAAVRLGPGRSLVAALPTDHVDATFRRVAAGAAGLGFGLLAVVSVLGWWISRLGLRPIRQVAIAADAIAAGDLARRVDPPPAGTEAGHLARAFNVMVDGRQAAEDRLRRFVADASHELRTPLTTITGVHELVAAGALAGHDRDEALRRARAEAERMALLVEDLLLLTQLDHDRPLADEEVDLGAMVRDTAVDVGVLQPDRPVEVAAAAEEGCVVRGDEALLRQVVGNLAANALAHTPATAALRLAARPAGDGCVVEVADDGPGLTAEQADRLFERFYRVAPGRDRGRGGGSGLGLSIVRSIVDAHRGTVTVTTSPRQGCTFRVWLPGNVQVT
jgi:two-component system, OmpR family, sensor kinase